MVVKAEAVCTKISCNLAVHLRRRKIVDVVFIFNGALYRMVEGFLFSERWDGARGIGDYPFSIYIYISV